ncbi:histidinol dehydrogenase [Aphanothece hegewaldii CCALA 016]|uniref:Histidinol dehydrogenase n=1 Tax=Aphanothece hegewaldii CCALA 016 TaxID=2107694 RepID=A0A2T1LRB1_9CHRO|nr:histidinol dehydrogenase [Aphanothece hegewaldii]PSF31129.1 histidinol dehydrogenase [Aphanothece hegewaldii CCALA 016]
MLRIVTQLVEAQTELRRIRDRFGESGQQAQEAKVKEVLDHFEQKGDQALIDLGESPLSLSRLKVSGSELDAAYQQVSKELLKSIQLACAKAEAFHLSRVPKSWVQFGDAEIAIAKRYRPVSKAGIYVPNGNQAHLSWVLMQAIPAKIAQVQQVIMVTPPGENGKIHPGILVAAQEAGVTNIYRMGGVGAIAALAYGTQTIPKVDVITGGGDFEVAMAKKMVSDRVKIDTLTYPWELLIIADQQADPKLLAVDLLAQAEQHPYAASILITTSLKIADSVQQQIKIYSQNYSQRISTEKALAHYGLIIVVETLDKAIDLSNFFAPAHLALWVDEPWEVLEQVKYAGTVLMGSSTPKIVGEYFGGTAFALATAIGVETFMQSSSVIEYSPIALRQFSNILQILAQADGYLSGIDAIRLRMEGKNKNEYDD